MLGILLFLALFSLFYLLTGGSLPAVRTVRSWLLQFAMSVASALFILVAASAAFGTPLVGVFWAPVGWLLPGWVTDALRSRKLARLRAMARSFVATAAGLYAAGKVTHEVVKTAGDRTPEPLGREFRDMYGRYRLNPRVSFPSLFRKLGRKYELPEMEAVAAIVEASERVGGPAAAARGLKRLGRALRQRDRLLAERRKETYETKLAAWVAVGALLFGLLLDATTLRGAFQEPGGKLFLAAGSAVTAGMIVATVRLTGSRDL